MKFQCKCGHLFVDQTDNLAFKAYTYPDQSQEALFNAIDNIFNSPTPGDAIQRDRMMDKIVSPSGGRTIYQCPDCGRIHLVLDDGSIASFKPESDATPTSLLQGK